MHLISAVAGMGMPEVLRALFAVIRPGALAESEPEPGSWQP